MAIKAGQLLHTGDSTLIQRLQSGGPGVNFPTNRIGELGNYKSVAITRDTPDLTFTMESYDVTTAPEQMLTKDNATPYDVGSPLPLDVVSQWKAGKDAADPFLVVESVALPHLALESASYRFGLRDNAGQTFTLRGDSIFYNPGASVVETFVASGSAGQTLLLGHPAGAYNGDAITGPRRALNVRVGNRRLLYGVDYTEGLTGSGAFRTVTITVTAAWTSGAAISVVYFTNDATSYDQTVHASPTVKPAAIRGKDITVLLNGVALTNRWVGVQSVNLDMRLTIDRDEEMGSSVATSVDYSDTPAVSGQLVVRFRDPQDFHNRLRTAVGAASATEALGGGNHAENRLDVVLHHPDTGAVLKTLEVPDAVINVPGYSARVNTKLDMTIQIDSTTGTLTAMDGAPT